MTNKLNINFDSDYTLVPNQLFRDKRLTFKAKGLFVQIISLAESWNFSISGLAALSKESAHAIQSAIDELIEYGYLEWLKTTDDLGRYSIEINVFLPDEVSPHGKITSGENSTWKNGDNKRKTNKRETPIKEKPINLAISQNRDLVFEAVCHVCKIDWTKLTKSGRGAIGKAVKELKAVDATPEEIYVKAKILAAKHSVAITPSSLAKHWASLTPESVEQIITDKQRNKALDEYHATQSNMSGIAEQQMEWLEKGLIDQDGNYIKQGEIE